MTHNRTNVAGMIHESFRRSFMPARADWNKMGPPLPLWFRLRIKRVDPRLVCQFIPPDTLDRDGVPSTMYPSGVWYVCARLRRTRWLAKRAVYALVDEQNKLTAPTIELVKMLRTARYLRKNLQLDVLERRFEESIERLTKERTEKSKAELMGGIIGTMRKMGIRSRLNPRVFVSALKR